MSKTMSIKEKFLEGLCNIIGAGVIVWNTDIERAASACASIHEAEVKELREGVFKMTELFQYGIHTIGALNDKLNSIGHTGFETTKEELQQHLDKFKQQNHL